MKLEETLESYKLEVLKALQTDIYESYGKEIDLNTAYSFWLDYSDLLAASFLGYEKGDIQELNQAIILLSEYLE